MQDLIRDELDQVLNDWHNGKEVRSIALGHPTKEVEVYGVRSEERHVFRQKKALECVFQLVASFVNAGELNFETFQSVADETRAALGLTPEETAAALSLAWKALHVGWSRALVGFPDHHFITVKREPGA